MYPYKPESLFFFAKNIIKAAELNLNEKDSHPPSVKAWKDCLKLLGYKDQLKSTPDNTKSILLLVRYLLALVLVERYLIKKSSKHKSPRVKDELRYKFLEKHIDIALVFFKELQNKMPQLNKVELPEYCNPVTPLKDAQKINTTAGKSSIFSSESHSPVALETDLVKDAIKKLTEYSQIRLYENHVNSFFAYFNGMNRKVKLDAVDKVLKLLKGEEFTKLTSTELRALKNARLGALIQECVNDNVNLQLSCLIRNN